MTRCNIQHTHRPVVSLEHQHAQRCGHRRHHRRHILRERNPNRVLRLNRAATRQMRSAFANNLGQVHIGLHDCFLAQKMRHRRHAGRRRRVQKQCARRRVLEVAILFGQHSVDHQKIAQDTCASLRCSRMLGDRCHIAGSHAHCSKDVQIDGRLQCGGALVRLHHIENDPRIGRFRQ